MTRFPILVFAGVAGAVAGPMAARAGDPLPLLVCAEPNGMPFSDAAGEGFENRLAQLLADELGMVATYYWVSTGRSMLEALNDGSCDVVMTWPSEEGGLVTTLPLYRSTYVFVSRADRRLDVRSLDDPALRSLRIGVPLVPDDGAGTPALIALARRGMTDNIEGGMVTADAAANQPQARFVEAVETGEVDIAILWGPTAGYYASRSTASLTLTPVEPEYDPPGLFFVFSISAAVRKGRRCAGGADQRRVGPSARRYRGVDCRVRDPCYLSSASLRRSRAATTVIMHQVSRAPSIRARGRVPGEYRVGDLRGFAVNAAWRDRRRCRRRRPPQAPSPASHCPARLPAGP